MRGAEPVIHRPVAGPIILPRAFATLREHGPLHVCDESRAMPPPDPEPDNFAQLRLLFTDPLQHDYEVIRRVVLFAETIQHRADATGLAPRTVAEKARRFVEHGMLGLADERT